MIFWRRSDDWMALLVGLAVVATVTLNGNDVYDSHSAWRVLTNILAILGSGMYVLVLALFPDGRFVPQWTRWLLFCWALAGMLVIFFPDAFFGWPVYNLLWRAELLVLFIAQVYRSRAASTALQRQQTKWLLYGGSVAAIIIVGILVPTLLFPSLGQAGSFYRLVITPAYLVISFTLPLSIGLAILRYRLYDIDIIINRTLVYGILTASVIAIYVLVVSTLGILLQARSNLFISLLATGLVAVLFQPLRQRLQHTVNRLIYGERDDPYRVIARLGQRVEGTLAADAVLPTIVETVAQALKLPYVAIAVKQEESFPIAASYSPSGKPDDARAPLLRLPLVYQTEQVGELVLAPRAAGETFTSADQRLLEDLAHQIGVALHTVQLTADLQRLTVDLQYSRERLIIAREEERRRLRRDLHDGIGPTLASLFQRLDTARRLVPHDPDAAVVLLDSLKGQVKATIADIRRVVYALRPPVLDELGLVSALREHTAYAQASNGLRVSIEAPETMPKLSAAVEVAAYRIVLEALTNVERHAHAHTCLVRLDLSEAGALCLQITDDGVGLSEHSTAGVGLTSMRERAAELSGECKITSDPTRGTRVWVRLPVSKEERDGTDPPADRR
jgi:signal transduction histidine kinase